MRDGYRRAWLWLNCEFYINLMSSDCHGVNVKRERDRKASRGLSPSRIMGMPLGDNDLNLLWTLHTGCCCCWKFYIPSQRSTSIHYNNTRAAVLCRPADTKVSLCTHMYIQKGWNVEIHSARTIEARSDT